MLLSKRLFPYPVLKREPHQDYNNSVFKLEFEADKVNDDGQLSFKNIQFTTNNDQFRNLVLLNKIEVYAHFECSTTLYRKTIKLNSEPSDYYIDKNELSDKLFITAFAVAATDINSFYDDDFAEDYNNTRFDIDRYDIVAFDDGYSIDVIHNLEKDDKVSSIFVVIPKIDDQNDGAEFTYQSSKIIIKLPQLSYKQYDRLKYIDRYQNLFFSTFAIPVLAMALIAVKDTPFDDLEIEYKWFISVKKAYENHYNHELTEDEFQKIDCFKFAQLILNNAVIKTINDLYNEGSATEEVIVDEED